MVNKQKKVNREYKDRLFKLIFREKKDLMQLYNAINDTDYDNPDDFEVNTLDDVVYMGMKNDISFLVKDVLNLYEHQSTFSPNLPLRGLFYFSDLYRKLLVHERELYSSKRIPLPFPQFVVFYNGTKTEPEQQIFYLHESFPETMSPKDAALDCRAVILNINIGHNKKIMQKCRKLEEYSIFIGRIREYAKKGYPIEKAIDIAVDECIREGILAIILQENREEVCSMLLTEYDEQAHIENEREIAKEEEQKRVCTLIQKMVQSGKGSQLERLSDPVFLQEMFELFQL